MTNSYYHFNPLIILVYGGLPKDYTFWHHVTIGPRLPWICFSFPLPQANVWIRFWNSGFCVTPLGYFVSTESTLGRDHSVTGRSSSRRRSKDNFPGSPQWRSIGLLSSVYVQWMDFCIFYCLGGLLWFWPERWMLFYNGLNQSFQFG